MKTNKLLALLMSSVMVIGTVTACDKPGVDPTAPTDATTSETTQTTEPTVTETTVEPPDIESRLRLSISCR